jgi:hypothetical protein
MDGPKRCIRNLSGCPNNVKNRKIVKRIMRNIMSLKKNEKKWNNGKIIFQKE